MEKKLYRDEYLTKRLLVFVPGSAEYFTVDVSVVRLLFVLNLRDISRRGRPGVYYPLDRIAKKAALPIRLNPKLSDYTVPPQNAGAR